jgi:hypothetical protein
MGFGDDLPPFVGVSIIIRPKSLSKESIHLVSLRILRENYVANEIRSWLSFGY